jgi:hypothetical protein
VRSRVLSEVGIRRLWSGAAGLPYHGAAHGEHDVPADAHAACDGLTDLAGSDDNDNVLHGFTSVRNVKDQGVPRIGGCGRQVASHPLRFLRRRHVRQVANCIHGARRVRIELREHRVEIVLRRTAGGDELMVTPRRRCGRRLV